MSGFFCAPLGDAKNILVREHGGKNRPNRSARMKKKRRETKTEQ